MIPIGDSVPTRRTPYVTLLLVLLNVAAFLWELSLGPRLETTVAAIGTVPLEIAQALARRDWVEIVLRLLASAFLHGGFLHLGSNMLFLWVFGNAVEERFGHLRYLLFYLVAAMAAGLAQTFIDLSSTVPMVGASGAVAGVLGAYFALYPGAWVDVLLPIGFLFWTVPMPAFIVLGFWFLSQLLNGLLSLGVETANTAGVAWFAHIGGFVLGVVAAPLMPKARPAPVRRVAAGREGARGRAPFPLGLISTVTDLLLLALAARLVLGLLRVPGRGLAGLLYRFTDPGLRWLQELLANWGWRPGPLVTLLAAMLLVMLAGAVLQSLVALAMPRYRH